MSGGPDEITGAGVALMCVILACFAIALFFNFRNLRPEVTRLVVLNTRVAFFLSFYAIMMFICINAPQALPALNVLITFMEGYSFYGFFAMIVTNLGGPGATVQYFKDTNKPLLCCNSCCPPEPEKYYRKTTWALWHFVFTRTALFVLIAIAFYSGSKAGKIVAGLLSLVAFVLLAYSLIHLVLLCKFSYLIVCE